jgi:protein gp37
MIKPRTRCLRLPDHWTPDRTLAVFEMIDLIHDHLWLGYARDIQNALREDQQHVDPR